MTFDLGPIREQFPALALTHAGPERAGAPRVYLDNPAGTQLPRVVLDRMNEAMIEFNANMHGNFHTSRLATAMSHEAHVAMADFYHAASPAEVVFGPNMTTLTFMLARVLGQRFEPGDELITTQMEHEGNNTPWRTMAAERGMVVKTLSFDLDTYEFDLDELDRLITPRTRFAALNFASNILGTINPIKEMSARLKAAGALVYVDAVQYAPHGPIDVQDLGCDFLVSSSYKYYGPHQGVLWGRESLLSTLPAYKLRVVPDVSPNRYETGCQSLAGQAGVIGAVEYLRWLGTSTAPDDVAAGVASGLPQRTAEVHAAMRSMVAYEHSLSERLITGLQAIDGVRVHGITDLGALERRVPTVSFSHPEAVPADVALHLDAHGVYVWNGHSYGLPVVERLGLEDRGGVVRIGPTHYNTLDEVDLAVELVADFFAGRRSA